MAFMDIFEQALSYFLILTILYCVLQDIFYLYKKGGIALVIKGSGLTFTLGACMILMGIRHPLAETETSLTIFIRLLVIASGITLVASCRMHLINNSR